MVIRKRTGLTSRSDETTRPNSSPTSSGNVRTGSSTESDRAKARTLFDSSESSASTQMHNAGAEASIRTLRVWGFSAISKSEAERRKQRDLDQLTRELEKTAAVSSPGESPPSPTIWVPKKKKTKQAGAQHASAPVPVKVKTTGKRSTSEPNSNPR